MSALGASCPRFFASHSLYENTLTYHRAVNFCVKAPTSNQTLILQRKH